MPLVSSTYRPPFLFRSAHYATVWCGLFRKVDVPQVRERIHLDDGDFLDLDWSYSTEYKVVSTEYSSEGSQYSIPNTKYSTSPGTKNEELETSEHFSIQPQPGFDSSRYDLRSTRRTSQPEGSVESLEVRAGDNIKKQDATQVQLSGRVPARNVSPSGVEDLSGGESRPSSSSEYGVVSTENPSKGTEYSILNTNSTPKRSAGVAILLHGLEGHGQRPYITGNAKWLTRHGIDACAVNFRGCSGETNKLYRSYHSGATEDLDAVVQHVIKLGYEQVYLVGISLGGNMLLKYLGEDREVPDEVKAGIATGAPCDLYASLQCIMSWQNRPYAIRFRNHLVAKLYKKQNLYPEQLSNGVIKQIKTLKDFDDVYTSRAHGFADAMDYYTQCSSKQFLPSLKRPALIINAEDDTFLKDGCYPIEEAERYSNVFLEMPKWGGHVGFVGPDNVSYAERRVLEFVHSTINN